MKGKNKQTLILFKIIHIRVGCAVEGGGGDGGVSFI
jgi:hypothetical protein